ncbi:MAG: diguanylate cyclase [Actinobacteria bacterium]|nr:diguanylate cyclase [Actinomycetota bacterium]
MDFALLHRDTGSWTAERSVRSSRSKADYPSPPNWLNVLAALACAATLALLVSVVANPMGEATIPNLLDGAGLIFATIASTYAYRRSVGEMRTAWALLALAMLSWTVGEAIFDVRMQLQDKGDATSIADLFYLLFYPLALAGLWIRDRSARRPGIDARMLDSLIAGFAAALLTLKLVYEPSGEAGASTLDDFLRVSYPSFDVLLIWMIVYLAYNSDVVWDTSRWLLAVAMSSFLVADLYWAGLGTEVYAVVSSGAALGLGAAAIWSPTSVQFRDITELRDSTRVPAIVLIISFGAVAALAIDEYSAYGAMTIVGVTLVMGMILLRLLLTLSQNAHLLEESEDRAISDPLTGLRNHQYFQDRLEEEVERANRQEQPMALLAIDIDNFKTINDLAGHRAGDRILRNIAAIMHDVIRGTDVACRTGGDELAVIAPDCDGDTALMLADRLRRRVGELTIPELSQQPHPSISVGCCTYPTLAESVVELTDNADAALYSVKHSGRNAAALYDPVSFDRVDDDSQVDRVEAQLAARNADFRAVFAHAHDAMAISDEVGRILLVNDAAIRMLGRRREAMIGRNVMDFVVPERSAELERLMARTIQEGHSSGMMGIVVPSKGHLVVEFTSARFSQNRFLTTIRDVTASNEANEQLAVSEARFRGVFENALDAMFIIDDEGIVRDANRAASELTELSMLELVGSRVEDLVTPEESPDVAAQRAELRADQTQFGQFRTRDRHGRTRVVEYTAVADFTPGLHLSIVRDITNRVGPEPSPEAP